MRLLRIGENNEITFAEVQRVELLDYAILSHTWGDDDDEVTYKDIEENSGHNKYGYKKLIFCGKKARDDQLRYFWVDTCCINKDSSTDVDESLASMFRWYRNAKRCYVYLADVPGNDSGSAQMLPTAWEAAFRRNRWLTRGWTLQELLAPESVVFFSPDGSKLGDKVDLEQHISEVTGIARAALGGASLADFRISERYEWARNRQTKREEDWAYCLQGIFGVFMSAKYGEGRTHATRRLARKIKKAAINIDTESFIIDNLGQTKIVNPLLLDIALLETRVRFDEARAQIERSKSSAKISEYQFRINEAYMTDWAAMFIKFLKSLLLPALALWGNWTILPQLERRLDTYSDKLRHVINSNLQISSQLGSAKELGSRTQQDLIVAMAVLQAQAGESPQPINTGFPALEMSALEQYVAVNNIEVTEDPEDPEENQVVGNDVSEHSEGEEDVLGRLLRQIPQLREEAKPLRLNLQQTNDKITAQLAAVNTRLQELEDEKAEVERKRREWAAKTTLQKIWGWLTWLITGS